MVDFPCRSVEFYNTIYGYYLTNSARKTINQISNPVTPGNMTITSTEFLNNQNIPSKYTCDGANINPQLEISGVPKNTKSLALIVDDPDSPSGTFTHWIVFNIIPSVEKISENSVPKGAIQGTNDFGESKYKGPCPGAGTHRYIFTLYAINTTLNLKNGAGKNEVVSNIKSHIIGETRLTGLYKRQ